MAFHTPAACVKQQRKTFFKRFLNLIGSLGHHQNLTHCWHHGTRHAKFHNQPFIMRRAIWRHVFGHTDSLTHSLTLTHIRLNHQRLVSDKSAIPVLTPPVQLQRAHINLPVRTYKCILETHSQNAPSNNTLIVMNVPKTFADE